MTYNDILAEVNQLNAENLKAVEQLQRQWSATQWAWTPEPSRWSAFQCIEHLNNANSSYIEQIAGHLSNLQSADGTQEMKHGLIANFLVRSVMKRNNKMKAPKFLQPQLTQNNVEAVEQYKRNNQRLQDMLNQLKHKNLAKPRIISTGGKLFQPKIGDVLRMIIHHDKRHIEQAQRMAQFAGFPGK
jgi:hypothetical protein